MTRIHTTIMHISRPSRSGLLTVLTAGAVAATACGGGPTAGPSSGTAPAVGTPVAVQVASDLDTSRARSGETPSALLDGREFDRLVEEAIAALPTGAPPPIDSDRTRPPSALLDGYEFARAVEAAIAALDER